MLQFYDVKTNRMYRTIKVDKSLKQSIKYKDDTFPFGIWTDNYKDLYENTLNCHWHYDFEFDLVLSGSVDFFINDTHIKLRQGDSVFINSNVLHTAKKDISCDNAVTLVLTFPTSLLTENINSTMYAKYFEHVLNMKTDGFIVSADNPSGDEIRKLLTEITCFNPDDYCYELKCIEQAAKLWMASLRFMDESKDNLIACVKNTLHAERMKEILYYIHEHYHEKITADDIAKHVNISRCECFRCFKRFASVSLVEYINNYRLMKAAKLLKETEMNITQIHIQCGFENASYFGKLFKNSYGVSPLRYRKL